MPPLPPDNDILRLMQETIREDRRRGPLTDADMLERIRPEDRAAFLHAIGADQPNPPSNSLDRRSRPVMASASDLGSRVWAMNPNNPDRQADLTDEDRRIEMIEMMRQMTGDPDYDISPEEWQEVANLAAQPSPGSIPERSPARGHTVRREWTAEEVRTERAERVSRIFKNHTTLKDVLDRHELTIQKRWQKKSRDQKRKIIWTAWGTGDMPKTHRPDFEAFRKQVDTRSRINRITRNAFMWPMINEEDLTRPRTLLLFLNSRGRNCPADFAEADLSSMHLGLVIGGLRGAVLDYYVMCLSNRYDEQSYGELLSCEASTDASEWLVSGKHMTPGEGLLVLEAQDKIYDFLLGCCKAILHDVKLESLPDHPVVPEPSSVSELQTGDAISWTTMAAESPYHVPGTLQFSSLANLLEAQRDAIEDHVWSLREDPAYYTSTVNDGWEHRQEHIKDRKGQMHPLFRFGREDLLWGRVVRDEVAISSQACLSASEACFGHMSDRDLPEDYIQAIMEFRSLLNLSVLGPIGQLKVALTASPPNRHYMVREAHHNPAAIENVTSQKSAHTFDKLEIEFFWLFKTLWEDGEALSNLKLTNVLDELQRMIDAEPRVRNMITPYVAAQISTLSIFAECLRQLESYHPWANSFEDEMENRRDKIAKAFDQKRRAWDKMLDAIMLSNSEPIFARHGTPTGKRFNYPVDKRRSRENVEAMREAERNLDIFWQKVDKLIHEKAGDLTGTATKQLFLQPRSLQRTPEWVDTEPKAVHSAPEPALYRPLSEVYFDLERRTERTQDSSVGPDRQPKTKQKTRGEATERVQTPEVVADALLADPQPIFEVDAKALKTFKILFYTPSPGATPGEVAWTDFLHAMQTTGFKAEKLYGSVWQFSPSRLDVEKAIQFHEPHGSMRGKIPFTVARRHGRRLTRNYGWHGGMFLLVGQ